MRKLLVGLFLLPCCVALAQRGQQGLEIRKGGGGGISGVLTGAYSFNGPFTVQNGTNVYLATVLSNQVVTGISQGATNAGFYVGSSSGKGTNISVWVSMTVGGTFEATNGKIVLGDINNPSLLTNYNQTWMRAQLVLNDSGNSLLIRDGAFLDVKAASAIVMGSDGTTNRIQMGPEVYISSPTAGSDNNEVFRYRFWGDTSVNLTNRVMRFWEMSNYVASIVSSGSTTMVATAIGNLLTTNVHSLITTNMGTNASVTLDLMGPAIVHYGISGNSTINLTNLVNFTNFAGARFVEIYVRQFGVSGTLTINPVGPHALDWGDTTGLFVATGQTNRIVISWNGLQFRGDTSHGPSTGDGAMVFSNTPSIRQLNLAGLTASRAAVVGPDGIVTNAIGTPDGTKFLRDDNTYVADRPGALVTNVYQYISASTNLVLDLGLASTNHVVFKVGMLTNSHVVLSNASLRSFPVDIIWQQDTNGSRTITSLRSTDGLIQTNLGHTLTIDTNVNGLSVWTLSASYFASNVVVEPGFTVVDLITAEIGFTGNGLIVRSGNATTTNLTLHGNPVLRDYLHLNVSTGVTGVGGANTNFTFSVNGDMVNYPSPIEFINAGLTNVNIVAIMGGNVTLMERGVFFLTNRTATSRTLSLGATTNNWISRQKYTTGTVAPFTITNGQAGRLEWDMIGTNVFYSYEPADNPI